MLKDDNINKDKGNFISYDMENSKKSPGTDSMEVFNATVENEKSLMIFDNGLKEVINTGGEEKISGNNLIYSPFF